MTGSFGSGPKSLGGKMTNLGDPWVPYARWHVTRYVKAPMGTEKYDVFMHGDEKWVALSNQDGQGGVAAAPHSEVVYPFESSVDEVYS